MEYISVSQAAEKWDISPRRVQILCSQSRIAGVAKLGNSWIIPGDAKKPERLEKSNQETGAKSMEEIAVVAKMVHSYYAGDYITAKNLAYKVILSKDIIIKYNGMSFAAFASIYTGDSKAVKSILKRLRSDLESCTDPLAKTYITFVIDAIKIELHIDQDISETMLSGNFSDLPQPLVIFAYCTHCKYLNMTGKYYQLYGMARAFLNFYGNSAPTYFTVYMHLFLAVSYYFSMDHEKGDFHFDMAQQISKQLNSTVQITEMMLPMRGCFREHLNEKEPGANKELLNQWKPVFEKWITVHNDISTQKITDRLNFRELCIATLAASGYTNGKISENLKFSESTIKKHLQDIFITLGINKRAELQKMIIVTNVPNFEKNGD